MTPFKQYQKRFRQLASDLTKSYDGGDGWDEVVANEPSKVNNLFMAGLGMGTLFLRMGAVIQMSRKLSEGVTENDVLFMKQIVDNLQETLPSDTNWKNIWYASQEHGSKWELAIPASKEKKTVLDLFVEFRNRFVHQFIRIEQEQSTELRKGLDVLYDMSELFNLFDGGEMLVRNGCFIWRQDGIDVELHPFVQPGEHEGLPYLFQGLYEGKTKAKFINTVFGDETLPAVNAPLQERFMPMQLALRAGAGQVFDHSDRLRNYRECFVGRDTELQSVLEWVMGGNETQVLPIYSEAGMGKGALVAGIIDGLLSADVPVLYHFCGSGLKNNLHAVLYHFILQGKKMPGMNGAPVWKIEDEKLLARFERLPSRYHDVLHLFQYLLGTCYRPPARYKDKPLVIIIDGLDEAAVANSQLRVSDWFYVYNENHEPVEDWPSPPYVKWIFTYRWLGEKKGGFSLEGRFSKAAMTCVQPLLGLTSAAVREALRPFEVSEEFMDAVIEKGKVS